MNLPLGAPDSSAEAAALAKLFDEHQGNEIDPNAVTWEPEPDDEERAVPLPWGFQRALIEPGPPGPRRAPPAGGRPP